MALRFWLGVILGLFSALGVSGIGTMAAEWRPREEVEEVRVVDRGEGSSVRMRGVGGSGFYWPEAVYRKFGRVASSGGRVELVQTRILKREVAILRERVPAVTRHEGNSVLLTKLISTRK